ncbi:MAG: hypothetical protein IGS38_01805 [Synechococcales cyanobacterium M58_A2018_015]|nr:hypothetical protein [Synechococcales cyanobacterium M58_A2018_015]
MNLADYVCDHPEQFQLELKYLGNCAAAESNGSVAQPILSSITMPPIFVLLLAIQLQIWVTTAHGETQILTERYKHNKLKIQLKAGISHIAYVTDEKIEQIKLWIARIQDISTALCSVDNR